MVKIVYKCGIVGLTNVKQEALDREYNNLQTLMQSGKDEGLYSANKQQALRFYKGKEFKKYPLSIRQDLLKLDIDRENKQYHYWARIPLKAIRGGVWMPLKPHKPIDFDAKILESKVIRKRGKYQLHLVTEKDIPLKNSYSNIIAIDLGSRNVATSVEFATGRAKFYGKNVRKVRGHYFHLRRILGKKKALKTIKKIEHTEQNKTNDELHKISREIVERAKETDSIIAMGILWGVRRKRVNRKAGRKIHSMPSYKLAQMIRYKAEQEGVMVIETYEGWTSKTCSSCGELGMRRKGLFRCRCGYEDHSDRNGAINIGKRVLRYICNIGASVNMPEPKLWDENRFSRTLEATQLVGW